MATIKITYTAITAPNAEPIAQICATFVPTNAAADLPVFEGTYYDTNNYDKEGASGIAKFFADSVAHPGLISALKKAVENGEYEFDTEDEATIDYLENVAPAVKDQGFDIEVSKN